ncbi:nicotinamide-nucleotide amidohydrolase family protein [Parvularcula dongshanensis]|uniref:Nicotinamide-nucleotide amidase n=1 Tax=Parvularcula dongshanensis TaxID=1173995 RepID=A0A840I2H6_9PROT|nr:nicotinamide-nucleotide amidase [Parvularcula dongshanensis]
MSRLAAEIVARAAALGRRVTTAESCTGGLIAAALTEVPGSSAVFGTGLVTYANEAKTALLGVPEPMLAANGAVSEEVARAMAEGALSRTGADLGVAVTGIAGPSGGSAEKPVGLVWFGLAGLGPTITAQHVFGGDRSHVRAQARDEALRLLLSRLD